MEYASGGATSAQVARGLGVNPTAVRNWKRSMLADDKERTMAHRTRTKSKARTAAAVDADMASLRREREGLAAELAGMRAERDRLAVELEMMRYSKELVGKEPGADPDNLTNSEKTRVVVHLAAVFGLRHSDLLERVGVARSTFYHNLKQLDRPGRDEWLLEPVRAAFEGFFGRLKQEFYHDQDHQDQRIDEFIDDLDDYLVWYRDERIKTQYGTSIRRHRQQLGLMA